MNTIVFLRNENLTVKLTCGVRWVVLDIQVTEAESWYD